MSRDAPPSPEEAYSGLCEVLLAAEEAEARRSTPHPSNRQQLGVLHRGEPVDICAGDLPVWARVGQVCHWWRRATVTAFGVVTFWDDDGSAWLAANGL